MQLADFRAPQTPAANGAAALCKQFHSQALVNHVMRSWLWAEAFAIVRGHGSVDRELLYTAAMLHDIGLVPAFDNHTLGYEQAGGYIGEALTAGAGWDVARRRRINDVIVRHNLPEVDLELDLEGHLLEIATGLDITGVRVDELPVEFRREVLRAYPRRGLAREFAACVTDQASRKPQSQAHRLVEAGLRLKLERNPLERAEF